MDYTLNSRTFFIGNITKKSSTYWDKNSIKLDEIHWQFSENTEYAKDNFISGKADIVLGLTIYDDVRTMLSTQEASSYSDLGTFYLSFNTTKKPLDNPKVRKAISLALDRKKLVTLAAQGQVPAVAIIPYGVRGMQPEPLQTLKPE